MISTTQPRRGEIWSVKFDPSLGAEMKKIRPAVVVNVPEVGRLPLCIVVPITGWDERYENLPWHTKLKATTDTGLEKESSADAFQVKSISTTRFVKKLGTVTAQQLENIVAGVALCIGFPGEQA